MKPLCTKIGPSILHWNILYQIFRIGVQIRQIFFYWIKWSSQFIRYMWKIKPCFWSALFSSLFVNHQEWFFSTLWNFKLTTIKVENNILIFLSFQKNFFCNNFFLDKGISFEYFMSLLFRKTTFSRKRHLNWLIQFASS